MFKIILNKPHIGEIISLRTCESVGELIENIFPQSNDCFYIKWNNIDVSLSYKYDLSIIFDDIVYIVKFLESQGDFLQMTFPSNTFDVIWNIKKDDNIIIITSQWNTVLSHNEEILNENPILRVDLNLFQKELSKLLNFVYEIIINRKYDINKQLLIDILENKPDSL